MNSRAPNIPTPNVPPLQDYFVVYNPVPETTLELPERRVFHSSDSVLEHALGARVVSLTEGRAIFAENHWNITDHYEKGKEILDAVPTGEKVKYFAKHLERPHQKLRKRQVLTKKRGEQAAESLTRQDKLIKAGLEDVRNTIGMIPDQHLYYFDRYIDNIIPPFIRKWYEHDVAQRSEKGLETQSVLR